MAAKGNKDAYVEIAVEDVKPDGANGVEDFETAETFEDDAMSCTPTPSLLMKSSLWLWLRRSLVP